MLYSMGMHTWIYWLKWSLHCLVPQQISIILLILIILHDMPSGENALLENSNGYLIYCALLCYSFALTSTCFLCVILYTYVINKNTYIICAIFSMVFWFTHPMVLLFVSYNNPYTNQLLKYIILLFPNVCFFLGIFVVAQYEQMGGIGWSQFFTGVSTLTTYPAIGTLMIMLLVDSVIYIFIAWYLTKVVPSEHSVHQCWNFLFYHKKLGHMRRERIPELKKTAVMEEPAEHLVPVIEIRNLNKAFGEARQIITDLNFDIYENQLTVVLGKENDAKSTIVNIIAGKSERKGSLYNF